MILGEKNWVKILRGKNGIHCFHFLLPEEITSGKALPIQPEETSEMPSSSKAGSSSTEGTSASIHTNGNGHGDS